MSNMPLPLCCYASVVVIHNEEMLYQVYAPLPLHLPCQIWSFCVKGLHINTGEPPKLDCTGTERWTPTDSKDRDYA